MSLYMVKQYKAKLVPEMMEQAIKTIKTRFQKSLAAELDLRRVTAPLFVLSGTGINDDLNGVERPVSFPIKDMGERRAEVVHSLAKWKRMKLGAYGIAPGYGLYTDMNAIRADEELDNLHSIYVDQWDWERTVTAEQRNLDFLKEIVTKIYGVVRRMEREVYEIYPHITPILPETIRFIQSEDLLKMYPSLSPRERETEAARKYGAIFVIGIGGKLSDGKKHDGRAPDYDDWTTRCSNPLSKFQAWVSGSTKRLYCVSWNSRGVPSAPIWNFTKRCSKTVFRCRLAEGSASRGYACSCCAARISAKCRPVSGPKRW